MTINIHPIILVLFTTMRKEKIVVKNVIQLLTKMTAKKEYDGMPEVLGLLIKTWIVQ